MKLIFPFSDYHFPNLTNYTDPTTLTRRSLCRHYVKRVKDNDTLTFIIAVPGATQGTFKVEDSQMKVEIKRPKDLILDAYPEEEQFNIEFSDADDYITEEPQYKKLANGILKIVFKTRVPQEKISVTHSF